MAPLSGSDLPPFSPPPPHPRVHFQTPQHTDQAPLNRTPFFTSERIHQIENTLTKIGLIAGMIIFIAFSALALGISCAAIYHGDWYISTVGAVMAFTCITACVDFKEILNKKIK